MNNQRGECNVSGLFNIWARMLIFVLTLFVSVFREITIESRDVESATVALTLFLRSTPIVFEVLSHCSTRPTRIGKKFSLNAMAQIDNPVKLAR